MNVLLIPDTADLSASSLFINLNSLIKAGTITLIRGDTGVVLDIIPGYANSPGSLPTIVPDFLNTDTFTVGVSLADQPPTEGTFTLTVGGSAVGLTDLAFDVTAATLQPLLSARMVAAGYSGCTVRDIGDFSFEVNALVVGAVPSGVIVGDASNLVPTCDVVVQQVSLGGATKKYQYIIELRAEALALAFPSTLLPDITVGVVVTQAMDATHDAIDTITFNVPPVGGTFSVSANVLGLNAACGTASFDITSTGLKTLLENHPKLSAGGRVSVSKNGSDFNCQFIGAAGPKKILSSSIAADTLITTETEHGYFIGQVVTHSGTDSTPDSDGNQTVLSVPSSTTYTVGVTVTVAGTQGVTRDSVAPLIGVSDIDLSGPQGVTGTIDLNSVNMYRASFAEDSDTFSDYSLSIMRHRASGENKTLYKNLVNITKEGVNIGDATPLPLRPGPTVGNTVYVDAVYGNDATGVRESAVYTFLTITAAQAAAEEGDTIIVGPGNYIEVGLGIPGLDYDFQPGANLAWLGAGVTPIFSGGPDCNYNVLGYGQFGGGAVPVLDASNSIIIFEALTAVANEDVFRSDVSSQLRVKVGYASCDVGTANKAVFNLAGGIHHAEVGNINGRAIIISGGAILTLNTTDIGDDAIITDQSIEVKDATLVLNFTSCNALSANGIKISDASAYVTINGGTVSGAAGKNPILFSANGKLRAKNTLLLADGAQDSIETSGGATPTVMAFGLFANNDTDVDVTFASSSTFIFDAAFN